jgi:hypothetical protein
MVLLSVSISAHVPESVRMKETTDSFEMDNSVSESSRGSWNSVSEDFYLLIEMEQVEMAVLIEDPPVELMMELSQVVHDKYGAVLESVSEPEETVEYQLPLHLIDFFIGSSIWIQHQKEGMSEANHPPKHISFYEVSWAEVNRCVEEYDGEVKSNFYSEEEEEGDSDISEEDKGDDSSEEDEDKGDDSSEEEKAEDDDNSEEESEEEIIESEEEIIELIKVESEENPCVFPPLAAVNRIESTV